LLRQSPGGPIPASPKLLLLPEIHLRFRRFFYYRTQRELTEILVVAAAQAGDYDVSTSMRRQRVKIKEIAEAMVGNTVWCLNSWFAPQTTPCAEVAGCTFKDCQVRLATPRELYTCRMLQIKTISS